MKIHVVEGEKLFLKESHLRLLQSFSKEVYRWEISGDNIKCESRDLTIKNEMFDWSVYNWVFNNENEAVLILNVTLFYKHPYKYILRKLRNVISVESNLPIVFSVERNYRNGMVSSPNKKFNRFLSGFIIYCNADSISSVSSIVNNELDSISKLSLENLQRYGLLYNFAYAHCFVEGYSFSHYVAKEGSGKIRLRKLRSVISEHIFSEILLSNCLLESPNTTVIDYFKYNLNILKGRVFRV